MSPRRGSRLLRTPAQRASTVLVAALILGLPLSACSSGGGAQTGSGNAQAFVAGDGSIVTVAQADRKPAPELTGTTLDGSTFSLASARGKVVVLNVWASWCAPCRSEAPVLTKVAKANPDTQFVGLVTRDSATSAKAFVSDQHITYPNVVDSDGQLQLLFRDTLPPESIPSTIVIDKQGRVAARVLGEVSQGNLDAIIEPLQAEPAS